MKERMQQTGKSGPGLLDPCVHVLGKGFRLPGFCLRNHECWHCAFDAVDRAHRSGGNGWRVTFPMAEGFWPGLHKREKGHGSTIHSKGDR